MNVTLTRHRIRLSNSGANRNVTGILNKYRNGVHHVSESTWKPLTGRQSANACVWLLVAVIVLSSVVGILRSYFG